jgi:DNA polymerase V
MRSIVGLVDCNNFYVSCERIFNPKIRGKPVMVLSNNDGLVIARSNEAKALGIGMGDPAVRVRNLVKEHDVFVFSSNYALYFDLCDRVRSVLADYTPKLEKYSIDEAFLDLSRADEKGLPELGRSLKKAVEKRTGIPVSVGIAETKSLAKVANKIAKKSLKAGGVLSLVGSPYRDRALDMTDVGDLWGIGPAYEALLKQNGVATALAFRDLPEHWVRKKLTVVGARIQAELKGIPCIPLESIPPGKRQIGTAQGFGRLLYRLDELKDAAALYATREGVKLRAEKMCAKTLFVWIQTDPFGKGPQHEDARDILLPVASNNTPLLIKHVTAAVEDMYKNGFGYKRIGVWANELEPEDSVQTDLFARPEDSRMPLLMRLMDRMNDTQGAGTIRVVSVGIHQDWLTRFAMQSPHWTTRRKDLPVAIIP